jgi:hypothetical protein
MIFSKINFSREKKNATSVKKIPSIQVLVSCHIKKKISWKNKIKNHSCPISLYIIKFFFPEAKK